MNIAYTERREHSNIKGSQAQVDFIEMVEKEGYYATTADSNQDMYEHWDVLIIKNPIIEYVDVKSMKDVFKYGYTWVEHQNKWGNDGWLRGKELKYPRSIAFERNNCFDFVDVHDLRHLIDQNTDFDKPILMNRVNLDYMVYRQYRRSGNEDRLILTPYKDIYKIVYKTLYK